MELGEANDSHRLVPISLIEQINVSKVGGRAKLVIKAETADECRSAIHVSRDALCKPNTRATNSERRIVWCSRKARVQPRYAGEFDCKYKCTSTGGFNFHAFVVRKSEARGASAGICQVLTWLPGSHDLMYRWPGEDRMTLLVRMGQLSDLQSLKLTTVSI